MSLALFALVAAIWGVPALALATAAALDVRAGWRGPVAPTTE